MNKLLTILFLTLLSITTKGQYPFEKYPAINYKTFKKWMVYDQTEKKESIYYTLIVPDFFSNHDTLKVQLTALLSHDTTVVKLFRNKKQIKKFLDNWGTDRMMTVEPLFTADINGDSLTDLKILIRNNGCGCCNFLTRVIYIFQNSNDSFTKIGYTDEIPYDDYRLERDFDSDGNYEIITQTFKNYKNHNYWIYNLYNFKSNDLVNVNTKDDYPIMIQLLYRENYSITEKVTREKMKDFEIARPEDLDMKQ